MKIKNKTFNLPIIQGGMGVGVSLGNLAGNVAKCGAIGTISSVNIGYNDEEFLTNPLKANLNSLEKEIKKAKEISKGNGLIAVNIMVAVSNYEETCKCAIESGADAIISGAGLPLKLLEYTMGTNTLCAPIVSSARAANILLKNYKKHYNSQPDFIVIEGSRAGGHLGFSNENLENNTFQSNEEILKEVLEIAPDIPIFVGGGIFDGKDMANIMNKGAFGVQIGTRFIATDECDAHFNFKKMIVDAKEEDIIIIKSPVGMPARAINSPLLKRIATGEKFLAKKCNRCLTGCKKDSSIPYCISRALIEAVKGNTEDGLFFSGSNSYRINKIITVDELINELIIEYQECISI